MSGQVVATNRPHLRRSIEMSPVVGDGEHEPDAYNGGAADSDELGCAAGSDELGSDELGSDELGSDELGSDELGWVAGSDKLGCAAG